MEHEDFQCITPVIVAKGLAHECLVSLNVLVKWPAIKEAIRVLLKRRPEDESNNNSLSRNPKIARLHNICLPRIMADNELKNKLLSTPTRSKVTDTDCASVEYKSNEAETEFAGQVEVDLIA